jgi:hypothetical protein
VNKIKKFARNIRDIPLTKVGLEDDPDSLAAGFTAQEALDKLNIANMGGREAKTKNKFLIDFREQQKKKEARLAKMRPLAKGKGLQA